MNECSSLIGTVTVICYLPHLPRKRVGIADASFPLIYLHFWVVPGRVERTFLVQVPYAPWKGAVRIVRWNAPFQWNSPLRGEWKAAAQHEMDFAHEMLTHDRRISFHIRRSRIFHIELSEIFHSLLVAMETIPPIADSEKPLTNTFFRYILNWTFGNNS